MKRAIPQSLVIVAVLVIGLSGVSFETAAVQAQAISWSEAERMSGDSTSSWFPEINADPYGRVRLVWESLRDTSDPAIGDDNAGALMLSELRDGGWTVPSDIYIKDIHNAGRPILASDDEFLYLISRSPRADGRIEVKNLSAMYFMRAPLTVDTTNAQSWSEPVRLTPTAAYWAQILPLGNGRIVLAYNQILEETANTQAAEAPAEVPRTALFVRVSEDYGETWNPPTRISSTNDRVARSALVISPVDGTLILAWDVGYDNLTGQGQAAGIFTATSTDNGASWLSGGRLDPPRPDERQVTFAARGSVESSTLVATLETTMLVYRSTVEDVLLYRLSSDQGRTWSAEKEIPGAQARTFHTSHNFDKLGLAADSDGRIILVFVGQDSATASGLSVQAMTFEAGAWSVPHVVASPDGYPEYPRLAIVGGNQIYLTYFVRDEAFVDDGQYVIWTVQGTTPAGPTVPAATPTAGDEGAGQSSGSTDDAVLIVPYPTVPEAAAPIPPPESIEPPSRTISGPLMTASLATFGFLALAVVSFRVLRKIIGF